MDSPPSRHELFTSPFMCLRTPPAWSRVWNHTQTESSFTPVAAATVTVPPASPAVRHPSLACMEDFPTVGQAPSWSACHEVERSTRADVDHDAVLLRGMRTECVSDRAGLLDTEAGPSEQYMGVRQSGFCWKAFIKDQPSGLTYALGTFNTAVEAASAFDEVRTLLIVLLSTPQFAYLSRLCSAPWAGMGTQTLVWSIC
jgi:hypothetical protein